MTKKDERDFLRGGALIAIGLAALALAAVLLRGCLWATAWACITTGNCGKSMKPHASTGKLDVRITPRTLAALKILRDQQPHTDAGFAQLFWPQSNMHLKHSNAGTHGTRRGAGAWLCSGSYLSKLEKRGLVVKRHPALDPHRHPIATLTPRGETVLNQAEPGSESCPIP